MQEVRSQEVLMQLVEATQMVATRTSLVHVGAPSHLGQLLPTALQLWSQDRLSQHGRGLNDSEASLQLRSLSSSYSEELRDTAVKLATDASLSDIPSRPVLHESDPMPGHPIPEAVTDMEQQGRCIADESSVRREGCPGSWKCRPHATRLRNGLGSDDSSDSPASRQNSSEAQKGRQCSATLDPEPGNADYLTIEEDEQAIPQRASLEHMSAAGQQLLLLLRVLRNLCATGSDATRAMADVGVPAQVACLISEPLHSNQQGDTQHRNCCIMQAQNDWS